VRLDGVAKREELAGRCGTGRGNRVACGGVGRFGRGCGTPPGITFGIVGRAGYAELAAVAFCTGSAGPGSPVVAASAKEDSQHS